MRHWSRFAESGAVWSISFMFWVYRVLGRWAFSICLYPVILYYFLSNQPARKSSKAYLAKAQRSGFVPADKSLNVLSYQHFLTFGGCILDKLAAMAGAFSHENVDVEYCDEIRQLIAEKKGGLILISHLGNVEVSRALSKQMSDVKLNILVHTKHAQNFNRVMERIDPESQLNLIQVTEVSAATAIMLSSKVEAGEFVVIAADRTPIGSRDRVIEANFMGNKALFPQGPFLLGSILRASVFTMFCNKQPNNRYQIEFSLFAERLKLERGKREQGLAHYAQQYADRLEERVSKYPMEWNNFFDFWAMPDEVEKANEKGSE